MIENGLVFSLENDFTSANVCLSVCLKSKPLSLSELLLSNIEAIDHQAYEPLGLVDEFQKWVTLESNESFWA